MKNVLALGVALLVVSTASANFFDDFESYADTAAMLVEWPGGAAELDTAVGNPGQSLVHPGGTRNWHTFDAPMESDAGAIVWEFDMYDDAMGNKRVSSTLNKTTWGWLEHGMYNDLTNPNDPGGLNVDGWGMRILGNGGEGWMAYPTLPVARPGWAHLKATITPASTLFEIWLPEYDDGQGNVIPAAYDSFTSAQDATGLLWDKVGCGGPSDLSSAGGGAWYDNMNVIPEPASLGLLLLGGLALLRRR